MAGKLVTGIANWTILDVTDTSGTKALTQAEAESHVIKATGTLVGNLTITIPDVDAPEGTMWMIRNLTSGGFTTTVKTVSGTGQLVTQGQNLLLISDGTNLDTFTTDFREMVRGNKGTAPVTLTQNYSTADPTLAAYTPDDESGAYTGIDNLQGGTVYATNANLTALKDAYENLRGLTEDLAQFVNSIVDDEQAFGLKG
tara:strand:- start:1073 stop:1669 length:597 start_codon:yes stop_codon:yes gene_type:complete